MIYVYKHTHSSTEYSLVVRCFSSLQEVMGSYEKVRRKIVII